MELVIEKMVQGGVGLSRLSDGRVCFVSQALPGERVRVALSREAKDYTEAKIVDVLEASPLRIKPKCPLYEKCGGCSLQHISLGSQVQFMAEMAKETFLRIGKTSLPDSFEVHHGEPWHYRHRARVFRGPEGWGFRAENSHRLISFDECPVLTQSLNEFLHQENIKKIRARELQLFDNGAGRVSYYYKGMTPEEQRLYSDNSVSVLDRSISMDASVFFQSNLSLLPTLVHRVRTLAFVGEWLIDLFSGVGFFASLLEDRFSRVTTVERDKYCLRHAKLNLKKSAEQVTAPAEQWLSENTMSAPAVLIVDPPRTGLPADALKAISEGQIQKLIYVSCNPVTLARDTLLLKNAGFQIKTVEGFAFYPHTPHLEMLLVLERG